MNYVPYQLREKMNLAVCYDIIILGTHVNSVAADKGAENDKINCRMKCIFLKMMNNMHTEHTIRLLPSDHIVLSELHFPQH